MAKTQRPVSAPSMDGNRWQGLLDQLDQSSDRTYYFPKEGRTRIRLVGPRIAEEPGYSNEFFAQTARVWQGQVRTRYLILGVVLGTSNGDVGPDLEDKVKPIVVNKTTLKGILTLLAEGYDFLSPDGHGITIVRSGNGLDTDYNILPSQKPLPVDFDELEWPDDDLQTLATKFEAQSRERDANRPAKGEDKLRKAQKSQESAGDEW